MESSAPGWQRFLEQYRSYMQLILLAAAIVSLAIQQWSRGVLLIFITVLNAVVGLRQEGKAESAMNALKAMVKATARVRRDGSEAEPPPSSLAAPIKGPRSDTVRGHVLRICSPETPEAQIGSFTRFRIRSGRLPSRTDMCLNPAGTTPIVCPSA